MLTWIFIGVATFAFAQTPRQSVDTVERAREQLRALDAKPCATCAVTQAGAGEPKWRQCFQAICPKGFGQIQARALSAYDATKLPPEVDAALRADLHANLEFNIKALRALQTALKENLVLRDAGSIRLFKLGRAFEHVGKVVYDERGQIDLAASRAKMGGVDKETVEDVLTIKSVASEISRERVVPLNAGYEYLAQRLTRAQIQAEALAVLEQMPDLGRRIERGTGVPHTFAMESIGEGVIQRLKAGTFTGADVDSIKSASVGIRIIAAVAERPEWRKVTPKSIRELVAKPGEGAALEAKIDAHVRRLESYLKDPVAALAQADDVTDSLDDTSIACRQAVANAREFAPTEAQRRAFTARLPGVRATFARAVKSQLSAASFATLQPRIDAWLPAQPQVADEQLRNLVRELREGEREARVAAKFVDDPHLSRGVRLASPIILGGRVTPFNVASNVKDACNEATVGPVKDHALMGRGEFMAGPVSVTDPDFGAAVLAHEFGHLLGDEFRQEDLSQRSRQWYRDVRSCLAEVKGDDQTVDEDLADFMKSVATGAGNDQFCQLLDDDKDQFTLDNGTDSHSTTFRRILRGRVDTGRAIPKVCTAAMKEKGLSFETRSCVSRNAGH